MSAANFPGSGRVLPVGDNVLATADFLCNSSFRAADASYESLFRRDAETSTRDACATRKCSANTFSIRTRFRNLS